MKRFTRRTLMRGAGLTLGGAALAPLLSRIASADDVARRFVFVVEGNGFEPVTMLSNSARRAIDSTASMAIGTERWWHARYRHEAPLVLSDGDLDTAPALGPLADAGLLDQSAVVLGLSSKITGGGHSASHGALSSARTSGSTPGGQTIDAYLAGISDVVRGAPYDAIRLGVGTNTGVPISFGTCAYGEGRSAPMLLQPSRAFDTLFGSVAGGAAEASFGSRAGLLAFARAAVQADIAGFGAGMSERAKLERYEATIGDAVRRQERVVALRSSLATYMPELPATNPLHVNGHVLNRFRAQLQLGTAALQAGLTNVLVVGSGTGGDFGVSYQGEPGLGSLTGIGRHDLHHRSAGDAATRTLIHEVTRRQVAAIADMATALQSTPEPSGTGGTMLDHTLIVFIGDNGEQHHSTASDFPVLLVGGGNMGVRTGGRSIVYPGLDRISSGAHRQLSNLWNTVGYAAAQTLDDFGAETPAQRVARGPLSELLA